MGPYIHTTLLRIVFPYGICSRLVRKAGMRVKPSVKRGIDIGRDLERSTTLRAIEAERTATALTLIPMLLGDVLAAADLQVLAEHWQSGGVPDGYLDRLQEVRTDPHRWRNICDCSGDTDTRDGHQAAMVIRIYNLFLVVLGLKCNDWHAYYWL